MNCPKCGEQCDRDSVDVGVGVIHGPYGCASCGWSESEEYDLSSGKYPVDDKGGAIDQWGGYHPPGSSRAMAYRMARETEPRPIEADWKDATALGSMYEQQIDVNSGRWRHRAFSMGTYKPVGGWSAGAAPN